jgi:hypothetical protein
MDPPPGPTLAPTAPDQVTNRRDPPLRDLKAQEVAGWSGTASAEENHMRNRSRVMVAAVATTAALWGAQVVSAAPAGSAPPEVVASALGGSILQLDSCNGPSQTVANAGFLKVERPGASNGTISVNVTYGGTLVPGTDYDALPDPIEIPAGDTQTVLPVETTTAGTITITVDPGDTYRVGDPATATATFEVSSPPIFCTEAVVETIAIGEQPTPILVEEEFPGPPLADTSFEPEGEAPPGLTLNRDGSWTGAATTVGTYEITGRWCIGGACVVEVPWRITVVAAGEPTAPPAATPAAPVSGAAAYTG